MRKLVQWALPAVLGIVPAMGAENTQDIAFLSQIGTTYKTIKVVEAEDSNGKIQLLADIEASLPSTEKAQRTVVVERPVGRFVGTSWQHFDNHHYSRRKGDVIVNVFDNGKETGELDRYEYLREAHVGHTQVSQLEARFVEGKLLENAQPLPVGKEVEVRQATTYQRPDDSTYVAPGNLLYKLILEAEEKMTSDLYAICINHNYLGGKNGMQRRHDMKQAYRGDVTKKTFKIVNDVRELQSETTHKFLKLGTHVYTNRPDHNLSNDGPVKEVFDSEQDARNKGWIVK